MIEKLRAAGPSSKREANQPLLSPLLALQKAGDFPRHRAVVHFHGGQQPAHQRAKEINEVQWIPRWGKERIFGMIENRRTGVSPASAAGGCRSPPSMQGCWASSPARKEHHVAELFRARRRDIWYDWEVEELLPERDRPPCGKTVYQRDGYPRCLVRFWSFPCRRPGAARRPHLPGRPLPRRQGPASGLVSLLPAGSVGTRGTAPYKAVLTHGFVVDARGGR